MARWKKGQSGNPSGRPTGSKGISAYIKSKTNNLQELVDMAYTLLKKKNTKLGDKLTIINVLLNRAIGTPHQHTSTEGSLDIKVGTPEDIKDI